MTDANTCTRCGADNALPLPITHADPMRLCPPCTVEVALEEAAAAQLHALIAPAVRQWAAHWGHAIPGASLASILAAQGETWSGPLADPYDAACTFLHTLTGGRA